METSPKHLVILGSGFAGIHAYRSLYKRLKDRDDMRVTIISNKDYFWFVPMAHEVATGNLMPDSIKQPLRYLPQNDQFDFVQGTVESVDADKREISYHITYDGGEKRVMKYDFLVMSLGADTQYVVEGAEEHTMPLRELDDVKRLKNTTLKRFERAQNESNPQKRHNLLHFIIVGGGATGVELAGELIDLKKGAMKRAFPNLADEMTVTILQRGECLIPQEEEWLCKKVSSILQKKGVNIQVGKSVTKVDKEGVWCEESFLPSQTIVWTTGVVARQIGIQAQAGLEVNEKDKRLKVRQTLQLEHYPNIFVAGDQAWVCDMEAGQPYPMRAQFAVRQGKTAARNIVRMIDGDKLSLFSWQEKGFIVSLGHGNAVARVLGFHFSGPLAWFIYRTAYLPQILGWRARLRTVFEWTLNLFLPRDLSEI